MTAPSSSTHPGQCVHSWRDRGILDTGETYTEECAACGARCRRDPRTNLIIAYDRRCDVAPHKPRVAEDVEVSA